LDAKGAPSRAWPAPAQKRLWEQGGRTEGALISKSGSRRGGGGKPRRGEKGVGVRVLFVWGGGGGPSRGRTPFSGGALQPPGFMAPSGWGPTVLSPRGTPGGGGGPGQGKFNGNTKCFGPHENGEKPAGRGQRFFFFFFSTAAGKPENERPIPGVFRGWGSGGGPGGGGAGAFPEFAGGLVRSQLS